MTLGVPLVDQARSYRGGRRAARGGAAARTSSCIARRNVGDAQRALLDYFANLRTVRDDCPPPRRCRALLVQAHAAARPRRRRPSGPRPGAARAPATATSSSSSTERGRSVAGRSRATKLDLTRLRRAARSSGAPARAVPDWMWARQPMLAVAMTLGRAGLERAHLVGAAAAARAPAAGSSRCPPSRSTGARRAPAVSVKPASRRIDSTTPRILRPCCRLQGEWNASFSPARCACAQRRRAPRAPPRPPREMSFASAEMRARLRGIGRIVAQQVAVVRHHRAAAARGDHDRLGARLHVRPPRVDVGLHEGERLVLVVEVVA